MPLRACRVVCSGIDATEVVRRRERREKLALCIQPVVCWSLDIPHQGLKVLPTVAGGDATKPAIAGHRGGITELVLPQSASQTEE